MLDQNGRCWDGTWCYYWSPSLENLLGYDGHDGHDFGVPDTGTYYALAAASGRVIRRSYSNYLGNYLDIYHVTEGYLTRYAHLADGSISVIDGQDVNAGAPIGIIGSTGNSTGAHLHFMVYRWNTLTQAWNVTDPFGWDPWLSPSQQITDPLLSCNGEISYNLWVSGFPISVDGQGGISAVPSTKHLGGWPVDNGPDITSPTAFWVSPSSGQTITSRTVRLEANASDDSSGVKEVRFSAKYNGAWNSLGVATTFPYIFDWDLCAYGVPSGDVELGLEATDNTGNKYVYSSNHTNIHITNNANCGSSSDTTPPTSSWISPSNGQTANSRTLTLSANASDSGSGIKEVRFSAKMFGTWVDVKNMSTPPYTFEWDMCQSGAPIGDIELGLEAEDWAGNKYVYSSNHANIHINMTYNCGTQPPVGQWNANYFNTRTCWDDHNNCNGVMFNEKLSVPGRKHTPRQKLGDKLTRGRHRSRQLDRTIRGHLQLPDRQLCLLCRP